MCYAALAFLDNCIWVHLLRMMVFLVARALFRNRYFRFKARAGTCFLHIPPTGGAAMKRLVIVIVVVVFLLFVCGGALCSAAHPDTGKRFVSNGVAFVVDGSGQLWTETERECRPTGIPVGCYRFNGRWYYLSPDSGLNYVKGLCRWRPASWVVPIPASAL